MVNGKFKAFIEELELTPEELSAKLGVGKSGIYKILRGDTKKISDKLSRRIVAVFPQYSFEQIKKLNQAEEFIQIEGEKGKIDVQKLVDIVVENKDKFMQNEEFYSLVKAEAKKMIQGLCKEL